MVRVERSDEIRVPIPFNGGLAMTVDINASPRDISAETVLALPDTDKQCLVDTFVLLEYLVRRNRSQHRRSHWFKSLQQFQKGLGELLLDMNLHPNYRVVRPHTIPRITNRLLQWEYNGVHVWFLRFSQLVADAPFAILGLALMACVARVAKLTGITDAYEALGSRDMFSVLDTIDNGSAVRDFGLEFEPREEFEDVGEVLSRDSIAN